MMLTKDLWPSNGFFRAEEFACRETGLIFIDSRLLRRLNMVRDRFGGPITVTSGYRSPTHNEDVGGVEMSLHMCGLAADIRAKNLGDLRLIVEDIFSDGGIGFYDHFIHCDIGPRRRW